ncbi:class I SAM-dependent methyltransferase [Sphingomonas cavernae]|uniref:Class I SAM-dependent methyltransferase n=1 Tax=Sphingomonas cavernae TaxID=2320861 RepID=A0A418W6Y6_9SPHN|nr:methyltransferase domain-containing protein [Sphingomonas cavernae]RJF85624.1 class I SAM-dependent methyltransferase [Sphingomonas cavernae]
MATMAPEIDGTKLEQLIGKVIGDVAGAMGLLLAYIGDQTGTYRALEKLGPSTAEDVAGEAGVDPRYVREWLSGNAAAGYVAWDPASERFSLTPEQAAVFAHEGEPTCMQGFFQAVVSQYMSNETAIDVFKSGRGRAWGEHNNCLFCGTDRFFRPGYMVNLVSSWIPALDGVEATLKSGGKVADIGCGHGSSTMLMAEAYPKSQIHGYDFHQPSIDFARQKAADGGPANTRFDAVAAKEIGEDGYDLACIFDALHDMGDPVGAARRVREILKPGGTFMVVEPLAGDRLEDNCHPLGNIFYGFSTVVCVPCSRAQEVGLGLGAQAGEKRLTDVLKEAGFSSVRRAAETPTNMVLEARV